MSFGQRKSGIEPDKSAAPAQPSLVDDAAEYIRNLFDAGPTPRETELFALVEEYTALDNAVDSVGNSVPSLLRMRKECETKICDALERGNGTVRLSIGPGTMLVTAERCYMGGVLFSRWFKITADRVTLAHFDSVRRKIPASHFVGRMALGIENHGMIHTAEAATVLNQVKTT